MDYLIQKIEIGSEVIDVPAATLNLLDERMSIISKVNIHNIVGGEGVDIKKAYI